ncbi:MAG TPA: hypothetical protein VEG65_04845, partial [Candidatus Bathyarchaeia archaeon]|nr:hypothetical protein [Candidatus Bathyarchaeia archaeon]
MTSLTAQHCVTTQQHTVGQQHVVGHAQEQHVEVVQLVHCAHVVAAQLLVVDFAAHWADTVPVAASATNASTNRETTTFFMI